MQEITMEYKEPIIPDQNMMKISAPNGILGDSNSYNIIYASQNNRWIFNLMLLEIVVDNGICAL
jgi:hypothetical protein